MPLKLCREVVRPDRSSLGALLITIAVPLALAIVGFALQAPRRMHVFVESKVDIARATVKKYAYEAYPSWSVEHPYPACPRSVLELNDWMNNKDARDPWGSSYFVLCGSTLPPGAKGIGVASAGEDGAFGTADDITSWE